MKVAMTAKQAHTYNLLAQYGPATVLQLARLELANTPNPTPRMLSKKRAIVLDKLHRLRGKKRVRLIAGSRWEIGSTEQTPDTSDFVPEQDWQAEHQAWVASVQQAKTHRQQAGQWQAGS